MSEKKECLCEYIKVFQKFGLSRSEAVVEATLIYWGDSLESIGYSVVERDGKWCVIHGHPKKEGSKTDKPKGTTIKCFDSKKKALAMHAAIMANK
jgi:hypothetical protein